MIETKSSPKTHALTSYTENEPNWHLGPNGNRYNGEVVDGNKHGKGIHCWNDGARYDGEWCRNRMHGKGTLTYPNGAQYQGEWLENDMHGHGTLLSLGNRYVGEWVKGRRHGQGTLTQPDGLSYDGEWKNDSAEGQGTCVYYDKNRFVGIWKSFQRWGLGHFDLPDGRQFHGEFYGKSIFFENSFTKSPFLSKICLPSLPKPNILTIQASYDDATSSPADIEWLKNHSDIFISPLNFEDLQKQSSTLKRARVICICGHGKPSYLQFSNEPIYADELVKWLKGITYKNSIIILFSCHTGKDGGIAQEISSKLKKVHVIAPATPVSLIGLQILKRNRKTELLCQMYNTEFQRVSRVYHNGKPGREDTFRIGPPSID